MESEMSVAVISLSIVVLCWVVVRINQKLDESVRNFYRNNTLEPEDRVRAASQTDPEPPVEHASIADR